MTVGLRTGSGAADVSVQQRQQNNNIAQRHDNITNDKTTTTNAINDTTTTTPCVFVLSQGADPTNLLIQFAGSMNYQDRLRVISLGQGQGPRAEALIETAKPAGDWVLLQNCHLAKSWMGQLEKTVAELGTGGGFVDDGFRLFLTSFPAAYFPVSVLQNSIKINGSTQIES